MKTLRITSFFLLLGGATIVAPFAIAAPAVTQKIPVEATTVVPVSGQVLGPNDQPVSGAQLAIITPRMPGFSDVQFVSTDTQGRFSAQLEMTTSQLTAWGNSTLAESEALRSVLITAPGLAVGKGVLTRGENVFHLNEGREVSGTIIDEAGRPLAGISVGLSYIILPNDALGVEDNRELQSKFTAKSDAAGRWSVAGLPKTGTAVFSLLDAEYSRTGATAALDYPSSKVEPLLARTGARIVGRVLIEGNKPLVGAIVSAVSNGQSTGNYGKATTDAEGRYLISGLEDAEFTINATEKNSEWVGPKIEGIKTEKGETTSAPDLTLGHGFFVEGTVVDKDTGLPVRNAQIGVQGAHGFSASSFSDEKGRYRLRLIPGETRLYMFSTPLGYVRDFAMNVTFVAVKGQDELSPIRIARGATLTGTAVDEEGMPATGVKLLVGMSWNGSQATVDANGDWKMIGVDAGPDRQRQVPISVEGEWEIVEPKSRMVPTDTPIAVVVKRIALATLKGRVISTDGKSLESAKLQLEVRQGAGGTYLNATSDAEGNFSITKLRPDSTVLLKAEKAGYKFIKGGVITKNPDGMLAEDIIMAPLSASVTGRVVNAEGAPVAGAKVIVKDSEPLSIVTTDEEGYFTIGSLPEGAIHILAAHGYDSAEIETTTGAADEIELKLSGKTAPPTPGGEAAKTLAEALKNSADEEDRKAIPQVARLLAANDPELALSLVTNGDGAVSDQDLEKIISALARRNPTKAAQWAPAQLDKLGNGDTRRVATFNLAIACAEVAPQLAEQYLQQLKATQKITDLSEQAALTYCQMAALAGRLGHTDDALKSVDFAVTALEQTLGHQKANQAMNAYAEIAAEGGANLVRSMIAYLGPDDTIRVLERAMPPLARRDIVGAQALLKEMAAAMAELKRAKKPVQQQVNGMYRPPADQSYAAATYAVVKELRNTDATAAAALASSTQKTPYTMYDKPSILMLAAEAQTPEVALPLLKEAMRIATDGGNSNAEITARIAGMSSNIDASTGAEFFARTKKSLDNAPVYTERMRPSFAAYAFYHAPIDPAESRIIIEAEWARRMASTSTDDYYKPIALKALAQAMSAVDIPRAMEMAHAINNNNSARTSLYAHMVRYLLSSDVQRRTMVFGGYTDIEE